MTPRTLAPLALIVLALLLTAVGLGRSDPASSGPGPTPTRTAVTVTVAASDAPPWVWPTGSRVVERGWEPPSDDYAAGHRGIDVSAPLGSTAVAVDDGVVTFSGPVGGRTVVTIDHGSGLVSTLDSVVPRVAKGDVVRQGAPVGEVAVGHCPATAPCVHLGARLEDRYVDPTPYLPAAEWPVLLPESAWPG
ncbi:MULTISPECIES: murein hydrolase activator EnvC family protein [unclassified Curtobacterium]|uniref:murein hydrolase activator EnvC family protein n=1 Tax=unclassified Curtobacterium TaxID=257496 RepID=UPI0037FEC3A0